MIQTDIILWTDNLSYLVIRDRRLRWIDQAGLDWDAVGWAPEGVVESAMLALWDKVEEPQDDDDEGLSSDAIRRNLRASDDD